MRGGLWIGGFGAGKSRALRQETGGTWAEGALSDRVLILLPHQAAAAAWHPRRVRSFAGWLWQEIHLHWPLVESQLWAGSSPATGGAAATAPRRLPTAVLAHLMAQAAERSLDGGGLAGLPLPAGRIGSLLARRLHRGAALAGLPAADLAARIAQALGGEAAGSLPGELPGGLPGEASRLVRGVRQALEQARVVDTGLAADLWRRCLLPRAAYRQSLLARWDGLVMDDIGDLPPLALELVRLFREGGRPVWLAYDPDSGHDLERGAAGPEALDHPALQGLPRYHLSPPARPAPRITHLDEPFRGDLLRRVAGVVRERLAAGIPAPEIALLSPRVDAGLRVALERILPAGTGLQLLPPVQPLAELPGPRVLLTLARLAHPEWERPPTPDEVAQAVGLALDLDLDPVRSRAVAAAYHRLGRLPGLRPPAERPETQRPGRDPEGWLTGRLGPGPARRYQELLAFLTRAAGDSPSQFLHAAAETWILPHPQAPALLPPCRQLIQLARTLESLAAALSDLATPSPGWHLVRAAAQDYWVAGLPSPQHPATGLWLGTPTAFLALDRPVRVQIWVDARSMAWLPGPTHPLTNPYSLRQDWPPDRPWSDALHRQEQERRLDRLITALLSRCHEECLLAGSALDSRGQECEGPLVQRMLARSPGRKEGANPNGRPLAP